MDAKDYKDESGQSVVEFLLMLPMLLGITITLIKVNTAIQISIVDQQYARAQTFFLTYNSPFYPSLSKQKRLVELATNQLVVGVSDNAPDSSESDYTPKATIQSIVRSKKITASDTAKEEPTLRAKVRIRNTVTLCTQTLTNPNTNAAILPMNADFITPAGLNSLQDNTRFKNLCGSPMKYEQ